MVKSVLFEVLIIELYIVQKELVASSLKYPATASFIAGRQIGRMQPILANQSQWHQASSVSLDPPTQWQTRGDIICRVGRVKPRKSLSSNVASCDKRKFT